MFAKQGLLGIHIYYLDPEESAAPHRGQGLSPDTADSTGFKRTCSANSQGWGKHVIREIFMGSYMDMEKSQVPSRTEGARLELDTLTHNDSQS
jgi:hypothetical protein